MENNIETDADSDVVCTAEELFGPPDEPPMPTLRDGLREAKEFEERMSGLIQKVNIQREKLGLDLVDKRIDLDSFEQKA